MIENLKPGTSLTQLLTVILVVCGFCLGGAGPVGDNSTPTERKAVLEKSIREAGLKWQGVQYQREKLRAEDNHLKIEQEGYAREAGKHQKELKALIEQENSGGVNEPKKGKK